MFVKRILSGVQPTGDLHLGNYLGAIKNFVALQNDYECLYCVVDLHAITVWQDPKMLAQHTREVTAAFIASGIDPDKNIIFNQSQVHEHTQLAWIFNCVARMGWLNRMTQFKDKAGKNKENVSVGLFAYPNLMAADILIYKATHVPVGEDQKQHLELCRDIAQKFNNDFNSNVFPIIEPVIMKQAARVMSLRDGKKKMSKSDVSEYSRIMLSDDVDLINLKIKKAKTDSLPFPSNLNDAQKRPEVFNLISIFAALNNSSPEQVIKKFNNSELSYFKNELSDSLISTIEPIGKEINKLLNDKNYLDSIISTGADKARSIANPVINEVYNKIGLLKT
ncbi:MAG: Tryptophan--tRNA ligase [Alphaproteobacteria bacterium MarineAlpha5_Bin11]|nr:tryptophan--tRNA ligase [Pelagibacteraceae bacterium]PPR43200.1 MAG: Tryptophan--tRNA ligase [Alphaproteobacteria bacterium MarineAlpha5_Bin11]PPR52109.1 MAG: Tryptophan--tRNA ligase [Alphaproteobacteria bacterium MarineAlpha5_Bin10]|tara:strand:- start:416 stop:1420 length:1005 start_codon:yes stop_codon:yes gene_type:complete